MTSAFCLHLTLDGPDATEALARQIAPRLRAGDVLLLSGPIGAGKSVFARALIQFRLLASGRMEDIPSPTFTLVQSYDDGVAEIWHSDLYRLSDPFEIAELGLEQAFDEAICLVEWPDRLGPMAPAQALWLSFDVVDDTVRRLEIRSDETAWCSRLDLPASVVAG